MECLYPLWRKMMRSIILHSPGRSRFLFPQRTPMFCKTVIKNLQLVVKGFVCVAAAVTTVVVPLQKPTSKQQQSFTGDLQTFTVTLCTSRLMLEKDDELIDSKFICSRGYWVNTLVLKNNCYMCGSAIQAFCLWYIWLEFCRQFLIYASHLWHFWLHLEWMWWDYDCVTVFDIFQSLVKARQQKSSSHNVFYSFYMIFLSNLPHQSLPMRISNQFQWVCVDLLPSPSI